MNLAGRYQAQREAKQRHRREMLRLLSAGQPLARLQLTERLGISLTSVSILAEELISAGLVEMRKTEMSAGRPPELLSLKANGAHFLSVSAHRDGLRAAIFDLRLRCVHSFSAPWPVQWSAGTAASPMQLSADEFAACAVRGLRQQAPPELLSAVQAVSFAMPGFPMADGEAFLCPPLRLRLTGRPDQALRDAAARAGLPFVFGNGADFAAFAESAPYGQPCEDLLMICVNEGVDAGAMVNGQLFCAENRHFLNFGHLSVDFRGRSCACGGHGCLERCAGFDAIADAMEARTGARLSMDEIMRRYAGGDGDTVLVLTETAQNLARGLSALTALLPVRRILLGGGIERFGPPFLQALRAAVASPQLRPFPHALRLDYSALGSRGELLGGARWALENVWTPPLAALDA